MFSIKNLLFLSVFLLFSFYSFSQSAEIKAIMAKQKAGNELTEEEEAIMEKWFDEMDKKLEEGTNPYDKSAVKPGIKNTECPPASSSPLKLTELTRESYRAMAKGLMSAYGPKSGDLPRLKSLLDGTKNPVDCANLGAIFIMDGTGSASVYASAYSAVLNPDDILTANNLGVALKDMGDFVRAMQVLRYADKLKPDIGLVICNLGWVYREMGYPVQAKQMFEKALKVAPEMTSPYLGLGLMAQCEGKYQQAEEYLHKSLAESYSATGISVYKKAKAAQPPKPDGDQGKPLTKEKADVEKIEIPEMPVSEEKEKLISQKQTINTYHSRLNSRMGQLRSEYMSAMSIVRKQQQYALKDQDNALVFNRDFAMELMQIQDVTDLLLGKNSNYGKAVEAGAKRMEQNSNALRKNLPAYTQKGEKLTRLIKQRTDCGDDDICRAKVQAEIDKLEYELCILQKGDMDGSISAIAKSYTNEYNALGEAVQDYYAFTNPILERIYTPSFNEMHNIYREMLLLTNEITVVRLSLGLPEMADQYMKLKCVEPVPPTAPAPAAADSEFPAKEPDDCPSGSSFSIEGGFLKFEVDCEKVKISGGDGILKSLKRDSNKHETNVIAKSAGGTPNTGNNQSESLKITTEQGKTVKDIAPANDTKSGLKGMSESETKGRMVVETGPELAPLQPLDPVGIAPLDPVGIAPLDPVGIAPLDPLNGSPEPTANPEGEFELAPLEPKKD